MRFYWLLVGVLAVWRATHLLHAEDGPWDFCRRLRQAAGSGFWGRVLACFDCLSLWIAAPFAAFLGGDVAERLLLWPALSAGAILLLRGTERTLVTPPAIYHEELEDVLRTGTGDPPRDEA